MYIINITRAIKNMSINKTRSFIFENYYERISILRKTVINQ